MIITTTIIIINNDNKNTNINNNNNNKSCAPQVRHIIITYSAQVKLNQYII